MQQLKNIGLVLGIAFSVFFVSFMVLAFTYPSVGPTDGNVALPINEGDALQVKTGPLGVSVFSASERIQIGSPATSGKIVIHGEICLGNDCRSSWNELGGTSSCGILTDIRDGRNYKTVKIGNQCWMAENLKYEVGNSSCYANNPNNCGKYGRLYNWDEATLACPAGWRLSSDADWREMESYLGCTQWADGDVTYWQCPGVASKLSLETKDGNNSSGFNALLYDQRVYGLASSFWTSTELFPSGFSGSRTLLYRGLFSWKNETYVSGWAGVNDRFSVRCIRDYDQGDGFATGVSTRGDGNVGIGSIPNEYKLNVGGKIYLGEKIEESDVAEVASTKGYVDSKISEIRELVVQGFSPLAYGIHTQNECWGVGGEVVDVPESDNPICKISGSSCPADWNQFGYYSTAVSASISNPQYSYCASNYPCSCATEDKPWGKASYLGWQAYYPYYNVTNRPLLSFASCGGSDYGVLSQYTQDVPACSIYYTQSMNSKCSSGVYSFAYSTRTEIGCY